MVLYLYSDFDVPDLMTLYAEQLLLYRFTQRGDTCYIYHDIGTRLGRNRNLKLQKVNLSLFKNSHINKSIKLFNLLPFELKTLPFNKYKNCVRKFIKEKWVIIKNQL